MHPQENRRLIIISKIEARCSIVDTGFILDGSASPCHLCNQRLCCNPAHLELVTHLTNQRRRDARTKEAK